MTPRTPLLGAPIEDAPLPRGLVRELRKHGIATCMQLYELMDRCRLNPLRGLTATARRRLARELGNALPRGLRHSLRACAFQQSAATGIAGPMRESSILAHRRRASAKPRHDVATALRKLKERTTLPTKYLLVDWFSPVRDQGRLGSCTGWGSTSNREFFLREEMAPLFAYALAKHFDGRPQTVVWWRAELSVTAFCSKSGQFSP